jgi:hypothetical protein
MPQLPNMIADMVGGPVQPAFPAATSASRKGKGGPVPFRALLLSYAQRDNWPNFIRAQYGLPPQGGDLLDPGISRNIPAPRAGVPARGVAPPIGVAPPERPVGPQQAVNPFPLMSALAAGRTPSQVFAMEAARPAPAQQVDLPALFRSNLAS